MQQSTLTATGLPSRRVAPVFGVRGAPRKAFVGRSCVVKAVQRKDRSGRKEEDVHGTSEAPDRDLGTLDEPSLKVCITLAAEQQ